MSIIAKPRSVDALLAQGLVSRVHEVQADERVTSGRDPANAGKLCFFHPRR
jgi:hypothetical protein